jgi:Methyltransferase domain
MSIKYTIRDNPMLLPRHIKNARLFSNRLEMLHTFAKNGSIGCEVGVWAGDFSELILRSIRPRKLHLIDIEIQDGVRSRFNQAGISSVLDIREGDSSTMLKQFPNGYFDWIYIDGDHSYEGVKCDADVAVDKIKADGFLFFNDYKMGDHNYPNIFYPYGVIRVVNNLCLNNNFEMLVFTFQAQMYCDVVIRRTQG